MMRLGLHFNVMYTSRSFFTRFRLAIYGQRYKYTYIMAVFEGILECRYQSSCLRGQVIIFLNLDAEETEKDAQ